MKAKFVFEYLDFERGVIDPKEAMGIGNKKAQAYNKLVRFAEENDWDLNITNKGIYTLTKPLTMEVGHNQDSARSSWRTYGKVPTFVADALRYKVNWQDAWEEEGTPISLRKVYMRDGKETKQNLMGRLPNMEEAIRRININFPKELKKANS